MTCKIKNFLSALNSFLQKKLVFACPVAKRSLWFWALLFFVIFGLVFSSRPALAQIEGFSLNCGWTDLFCKALEAFGSVLIKIVVLLFFGIPLLLSALFVGIMALILGWIISPDFISLKFTQNPFVDIGLSITRNFANMGFIIFLVAIALATALRIEEYKAKKTLPTLILIALLINFSPVFVGVIIDASNIVMNFFLTNITGINGFVKFIYNAALSVWNLLVTSGFDVWANIAAAMQVLISIVFNFFAGFIFILFSGLFIMRYIMLWILVILSPIAFVSYILPVTRRGGSLLSWKKWWEQLIAWSIIGIIAGFFLYLGFTMISMINAAPGMFVTQPDFSWGGTGLGLMNNVLPYLIPLVLLLIAYKETKRTSAMFAREIIEMPEKVAKGAVMVAAIAATAGAATMAAGTLKGAIGTLSSSEKFGKWREAHPTAGKIASPVAKVTQWGKRGEERIAAPIKEKIITPVKERVGEFAERHPEFTGYVKSAGRGLKEHLWTKPKKEVTEGFKDAREDWKKRSGWVAPLAIEKKGEKLEELRGRLEREEKITDEEWREYEEVSPKIRERRERGEPVSERFVLEELEEVKKEEEEARVPRREKKKPPPKKKRPEEEKPEEEKPPPKTLEEKQKARKEETEKLAYKYFEERQKKGEPGTPEEDWSKAEDELTSERAMKGGWIMEAPKEIKNRMKARQKYVRDIKSQEAEIKRAQEGIKTFEEALASLQKEKVKYEKSVEELRKKIDGETGKKAHGIYQKRLTGTESGYTYREIDEMLKKEGKTPSTPEADKFMEKWDKEQAEKALEGSLISKEFKKSNETLTKATQSIKELEVERGEIDLQKARIETAKTALGQIKDRLTDIQKGIESWEEIKMERKEAKEKLEETKKKIREAKRKKI